MENVVTLAIELGYLKIPAGTYVELNKTKNIPDDQLVIITTGQPGRADVGTVQNGKQRAPGRKAEKRRYGYPVVNAGSRK